MNNTCCNVCMCMRWPEQAKELKKRRKGEEGGKRNQKGKNKHKKEN